MNTSKISWNHSILKLAKTKNPSQSLLKLNSGGIESILDLIYVFPLRIQKIPNIQNFSLIQISKLFVGRATIINLNISPAFKSKGRSKVQLFNITCLIRDSLNKANTFNLKWFNVYPNMKSQLEQLEEFVFMGTVTDFKGSYQIINPKIDPKELDSKTPLIITYPTINSVPGYRIRSIISSIPKELLFTNPVNPTAELSQTFNKLSVDYALRILHGKGEYSEKLNLCARQRLIYEEFFSNHLKILARKLGNKKLSTLEMKIDRKIVGDFTHIFPYELTIDQKEVLSQVTDDIYSGIPMMRMIQGDVGCGKTTVAITSILIMKENEYQSAFMCPTETLAIQHTNTIKGLTINGLKIALLIGSTKTKERNKILKDLSDGKIDLLIGTHALIQKDVVFKQLQLVIIDEQHKFGVKQRQSLQNKGINVHSLIMTATPIPRTLQLSQYGDLDISTIRTIPKGRKGTKTRIVSNDTFSKYLSFIKTRMTLGEQIYIVAPAIEESELIDLKNVNEIFTQYSAFFKGYTIETLHGQLPAQSKKKIMENFVTGNIDILISTSVIEVGIDVPNSTVISVYNPERFGLSSLHQLRGRVGRGGKPGFCFLITDATTSIDSLKKIKIIENTICGFKIAEADLKNRGEGDLFGASQSGHINTNKIGNIIDDFDIFEQVNTDIKRLQEVKTETLNNVILELIRESEVSSTI